MFRPAAALLAVAVASPAFAAPIVGVHTEAASPLSAEDALGTGFSGTVGYGFDPALVEVIPEVGATWDAQSRRFLPRVGGRVMVGKVVEPGVYAHAVMADGLSLAPGRAGWDAGALLDLTAIPHLDVGVHAGVLALPGATDRPDTHLTAGLHLGVVF